ncbi:MAG TPA: M23 family metallopeptidase [Acidimicrobiales bacterium]|nr:M23 family metallopeptidase [Acidimicrobiales bacterium]
MQRFRAIAVIAVLALAGQAAAGTYRVQRGDTLSRIARKHGTTVQALTAANSLANPHRIFEDQVLNLGGSAPAATTKGAPALSTKQVVVGNGERRHTVAKGQNLASIAKRYGTTSAAIAKANGLKSAHKIRVGQTLTIPGAAADWLCPVQGSRVDFSDSWTAPRPGGRRHMGTDLFAFKGTAVVAPVSGRLVHRQGSIAGLAFYLYGDDGNVYYGAHLDAYQSKPGRIERGGRIGTVGDSGNAKGSTPHLHLEIHLGGNEPINPYPTAKRWC